MDSKLKCIISRQTVIILLNIPFEGNCSLTHYLCLQTNINIFVLYQQNNRLPVCEVCLTSEMYPPGTPPDHGESVKLVGIEAC